MNLINSQVRDLSIKALRKHLASRNWLYIVKLVSFVAVIILVVLLLVAMESSRRVVARLTRWDCPVPSHTPATVGLAQYEVVQIQLQPGQALTAWYVPSRNGAAVLLLQGHWTGRDGMLAEAEVLARNGYGVMLLDPHTCAGPNVTHTMGQAEINDVAAAVKFLRQRPDVTEGRVGVLGFSMGGVIALESAARIAEIRAVVAEGNFDELSPHITPHLTQNSFVQGLLQQFTVLFYRYYTGLDPNQVRPIESVARIAPRPLLLIAGEDEIEANRTLAQFEAAGHPKELWVVPEVGHGGYQQQWPVEYEQRVVEFLNRFLLGF